MGLNRKYEKMFALLLMTHKMPSEKSNYTLVWVAVALFFGSQILFDWRPTDYIKAPIDWLFSNGESYDESLDELVRAMNEQSKMQRLKMITNDDLGTNIGSSGDLSIPIIPLGAVRSEDGFGILASARIHSELVQDHPEAFPPSTWARLSYDDCNPTVFKMMKKHGYYLRSVFYLKEEIYAERMASRKSCEEFLNQ